MLVLTRRPGQAIMIKPALGVDLAAPLGALFTDGPIEVMVNRIEAGKVKMGITAPRDLAILRDELPPRQEHPNAIANWPSLSPSRERLARNVFRLRMQLQWSVKQLADASQISASQLGDIESGTADMDLEDLDRLAIAFGTDIAELFRADGL